MKTKNGLSAAENELRKMGVSNGAVSVIREKDGITVLRVRCGENAFVLKYFETPEFRREIDIYKILNGLGITTIKVFASTNKAILMEDICQSDFWRLGTAEDMADPVVMSALARWYKELHWKGYSYIAENGENFYNENDFLTLENIAFTKAKTNTEALAVWKLVEENIEKIQTLVKSERKTFNYNDFYYTNLVVAKDKSAAFMYDYNLFGMGPAYSDISNVMWSLNKEAGEAFLKEYGEYDNREKAIHDVSSVLVSLYLASKKEHFPSWGNELLSELGSGFEEKVKLLLDI